MSKISEAHDKAFAMLKEGLKKEYKKDVPRRAKLSRQEDIAFVRAHRKKLFDQRRAIDKLI